MQTRTKQLIPLFLTVFIDLVGFGIAIPTLAVILFDVDASVLDPATSFATRARLYGWLIACYPMAQFIGSPIWGALSDRFGRKKMLIVPLLGTLFGYILFALGIMWGRLDMLFISRIIDGFAGGSISIALSATADISPDEKSKAKNFGLMGMAFGLGFILGPFIGGKLADSSLVPWFNASVPFWFAAIVTGINALLFILLFTETLPKQKKTPISLLTGARNIIRAFSLPNVRVMFLVIFLLSLGFNFLTQSFQVFLVEKFHFKEGGIGDLFAYVGVWIALSQGLLTRPLSERFTSATIVAWSIFFLGVSFPLLTLPTSALVLYIMLPFVAVFQGISQPNTTAIISELSGPDSQGEMMGINQSIQALGMMIPPLIAGELVAAHINLPIYAAGCMTLLAWGIFVLWFRPRHKEVFGTI
jgi:DHA1 family tetracycline resistance protein-like MFS transporter